MERNNILSNIIKIRYEKGFTQEYVAQQIGLKQAGYGLIERGERTLNYDKLLQIALVFEMDVIDIITYPYQYADLEKMNMNVNESETKILVEVKLNNKEFSQSGIKQKVIMALQ